MARTFASGDHIYYGDAPIGTWNTGTIAFRFKHTSTAVMLLASVNFPGVGLSYGFYILANPFSVGRMYAEAHPAGGQVVAVASPASPAYNDGAWHHLAYVWNCSSGTANDLYVDGALAGTTNSTNIWSVGSAGFPARINLADDTSGFSSDYVGSLADYAIWSNAQLNADEIAALAKGFPAHVVRPASLEMHVPLVRDTHDLRGRAVSAIVGSSVADHPLVLGGSV